MLVDPMADFPALFYAKINGGPVVDASIKAADGSFLRRFDK